MKLTTDSIAKGLFALTMWGISHVAVSEVIINDVVLRTGIFDGSTVSAEIKGIARNSCAEIASATYGIGPLVDAKEININLETKKSDPSCFAKETLFSRQVYLGPLDPGFYKLKVYNNGSQTYMRNVSIPLDITAFSLGIDANEWVTRKDKVIDPAKVKKT